MTKFTSDQRGRLVASSTIPEKISQLSLVIASEILVASRLISVLSGGNGGPSPSIYPHLATTIGSLKGDFPQNIEYKEYFKKSGHKQKYQYKVSLLPRVTSFKSTKQQPSDVLQ